MKTKLLVLFILFMILDGCASTNLSPVDSSYRALEADEMRLWKRSTEEIELIDASGLLYEDSSITNYINQVAQKNPTSLYLQGNPVSSKSYQKSTPQCVCLPQWNNLCPHGYSGSNGQ